MKWITDFNTAIEAGMAFRIPLTVAQQKGFSRIVVLGLKTGLGAGDSAARLGMCFRPTTTPMGWNCSH